MKNIRLLFLLAAAALVLLTGSCEVTIYQMGNATGLVVNADTGEPIEDATVSLTIPGASSPSRTARTNADGEYGISAVSVGVYELTAAYTNTDGAWTFTEETVEIAWDASSSDLPTMAGFLPSNDTDVKIIALWDPDFADVDAYLTVPNEAKLQSPGIDADIYEYQIGSTTHYDFYADTTAAADEGFHPDNPGTIGTDDTTSGDDRLMLYKGNTSISGLASLYEGDYGGPETVSIHAPVDVGTDDFDDYYVAESDDFSTLPETGWYEWTGVMEYYLVAWNADNPGGGIDENAELSSETNIGGANPRIFIFDRFGVQKGLYRLPQSTFIHAASVLRINVFYHEDTDAYFYQILPDIQVTMAAKNTMNDNPAMIVIPAEGTRGRR
ncbi:MAG: carboxypeptidase regulatory-like domain-containing protein [Spirochaetales bacterium]|nr:carboxypeptidase regulatory-like domain-containing protein [Spirochaetales bacterium]